MFHTEIIVAKTPEEASSIAADRFQRVMSKKTDCVIGLATGSTPLPLYGELIRREKTGSLSFSRVRSVNLDEYVGLDGKNPQSYQYYMRKNLFSHISIKEENTLIPDGLAADRRAECLSYERRIEEWGGIDLQLLGIGHNGHIGFNEPDDYFPAETHEVSLSETTRRANKRHFPSSAEVPPSAITVGIGTIMSAKQIILIAFGRDKSKILQRALQGPVTPKIPASILRFHPRTTLICDNTAYWQA